MRFREKLRRKAGDLHGNPIPTMAFLGDSVTEGCFECYYDKYIEHVRTEFDHDHGYHTQLQRLINQLYPSVPVNVINAGISGDSVQGGLKRLERDVLAYNPDLVVVCFGLNDCNREDEGLPAFTEALDALLTRLCRTDAEVILMTPNMMATRLDARVAPGLEGMAERVIGRQTNFLPKYIATERELAAKHGVPVCDCYARWQALADSGVDTTALLSNYLNHPTIGMHALFARALFDKIFFE